MITLPIGYHIKTVSKEELMKAWSYQEVLGFCQACNNYGKNYSCPDFTFEVESLLERYNYVTVILTEISSEPLRSKLDTLRIEDFSSRVSEQQNPKDNDLLSQIAMYMFNHVKDKISRLLLDAENQFNAYSCPPGACSKCDVCYKKYDKACPHEEDLRYSLEALGFLVSDIYKDLFQKELVWTSGLLPDAYHSCSCLFTMNPLDSFEVQDWLTKRFQKLCI